MFGIFAPLGLNSSIVTTARPSAVARAMTNGSAFLPPRRSFRYSMLCWKCGTPYICATKAPSAASGTSKKTLVFACPEPERFNGTIDTLAHHLSRRNYASVGDQSVEAIAAPRAELLMSALGGKRTLGDNDDIA